MQDLILAFEKRFNSRPAAAAAAPGRLEILGNHTDYNEGWVLSCAVDQNTAVALSPNESLQAVIYDIRDNSEGCFDVTALDKLPSPKWLGYPAGVLSELAKRNVKCSGFNAVIRSTVPLSAGMSSSAALETAFILALAKAFDFEFAPAEYARIGQGVENNYLGLKTGLLDQFSSIFGVKDSFILSDFRSVEVLDTVRMAPGCAILVVNSMQKHNLVDSEYNERREACESAAAKLNAKYPEIKTLRDVSMALLQQEKNLLTDREFRRACHVAGECERVQQAVKYLAADEVEKFGALWWESHQSSRENFENSTPALDDLIEWSKTVPGCIGARLSGGGFGGISIHLVKEAALADYQNKIARRFEAKYNVKPEMIVCHPGEGAKVLEV